MGRDKHLRIRVPRSRRDYEPQTDRYSRACSEVFEEYPAANAEEHEHLEPGQGHLQAGHESFLQRLENTNQPERFPAILLFR